MRKTMIGVRLFGEITNEPDTTIPGRGSGHCEGDDGRMAYCATGASTLCTGQDWAFFILYGAWARISETLAPNIT